MIRFIFGENGSGKTERIIEHIKNDIALGKEVFLIVPEQEAVAAERRILESLPPSAQLDLEVLNFSRLYNRVCREYGGLSYSYLTLAMKQLLMWRNLTELDPFLNEYRLSGTGDLSICRAMLQEIGELKTCGVTDAELETAAKKLDPDSHLAKRLNDIALIYGSYQRLVSEKYSDSADDMARLYEILTRHRFFKDRSVYIDSFTSFTAIEHKVIGRIFATAESCTLSIPLPHPEYEDISTAGIQRSLSKLTRSANDCGGITIEVLSDRKRSSHVALNYLSKNLWRMKNDSDEDTASYWDGSIVAEECADAYAEAEAAAAHILELMRKGARCRDIALIVRDPESYRGILEPALDKNDIPYFFSEKTDICALAPIKLILSALRIKQFNWRRDDVIAYVKTGLCDVSPREADYFESYINTWNINGDAFLSGPWTMNPDGFTERRSPRGEEILSVANAARERIVDPLYKLFILIEADKTIAEICRHLYAFLREISLEDKLTELAIRCEKRKDIKSAEEYRSIWGIIMRSLADIGEAIGDEEASIEELSSILRQVFAQTSIGTIPTSVDEVIIGSAATFRPSNPKYVFVLGLCEGEFPPRITDSGIFSLSDRNKLAELGIELSEDADTRYSDELMYVHRAFSAPSEKLFIFTRASSMPSLPFNRALALFGQKAPHTYDPCDLAYLAGSPRSAVSHYREVWEKTGIFLPSIVSKGFPVYDKINLDSDYVMYDPDYCRLDADTLTSLFKDNTYLSPTSFEKYATCPFSYYCKYVLSLREEMQISFKSNDIGSFIHHILEKLLKYSLDERPDREALVERTDSIVTEYLEETCPTSTLSSLRLAHLHKRLKHLAILIVENITEEFSKSSFVPCFFELSLNGKNGAPLPWTMKLSDGSTLSIGGQIDRVDIHRAGGRTYIRIVDYKTGTKEFDLDEVYEGLNTQMLLYLFALCSEDNKDFHRSVGVDENTLPVPAGILYLDSNIPLIELDDYISPEDIDNKAKQSLKRSGLLINDINILKAMNFDLSKRFLPEIKDRNTSSVTGNSYRSEQRFAEIKERLEQVIDQKVTAMRKGCAQAEPLKVGTKDPCAYCAYKPLCRHENEEEE